MGHYPVGHRNESEWKNIRKTKQKRVRGDKDRKLLEIWEKDRTWLQSQVRPRLKRNDTHICIVTRVYDKRLSEDEEEGSDKNEENELEELQTERVVFFLFKGINM